MSIPLLLAKRGFHPRQLFAALQGAWLEPKLGSMWQENTGVTPTTTGGQTIGLLLDQSQGAVLGPEKATAANSSSAWTPYGSNTVADVGGAVTITYVGGTNSGFGAYVYTPSFSLTVGAYYQFSFEAAISTGSARIYMSDGSVNIYLAAINSASYSTRICFFRYFGPGVIQLDNDLSAGEVLSIKNISVREILGNHASQSTAANRPTYQLDSNGLPLARHDATDSLVVSLPDLGGGIYSAAGSVYFATPVGMSALHNQSMATSYTLPALSTDIYAWIVVPQRLNAAQESRLARWMDRRSGIAGPDYLLDTSYEQLTADDGEQLLLAQ